MRRQLATCILACLVTATAAAQTVNPSKVAWEAPDHSLTARYELGYFMGTASLPVQTVTIAVADVTPAGPSFEAALPRPVLGNFTAKLKACGTAVGGGEVCSDWSNSTDPFTLSPRATVGLRLVP